MPKFELPKPVDDGLYIREVGDHSKDKHYFLARYIHAFTTGMKNAVKTGKWRGLHYLDLFAGAGLEKLRDSGQLSWGSPLIAAQADPPFQGLHLCEIEQKSYLALKQRVNKIRTPASTQIINGDANANIKDIVSQIPARSLSMAFLDPCGFHLDFETVRELAAHRCDLIIFFPDRVDALRNWKLNYHDNPNSPLDRVMGSSAAWREIFDHAPKPQWAQKLRELYVRQITTLGYEHFEYERIYTIHNAPIYQLIFCSKHPLGAKYWRKVSQKKPDQQNTFDFGGSS